MSFNIEQIKIELVLNTGQPSVTLKQSMLEMSDLTQKPAGLNEYPYFTADVEYPKSKLYELQTPDIFLFFFNKEKFTEFLSVYVEKGEIEKDVLLESTEKETEEIEIYQRKKKVRIETNITTMLELLFPTRFPVYNDLHKSHDFVFNPSSFSKFWIDPQILFWNRFSYIVLNGKKYTCKKLIWLNDILNHPKYRELIEFYRKFNVWQKEQLQITEKSANKEKTSQKNKLSKAIKKMLRLCIEVFNASREVHGDELGNTFNEALKRFFIVVNDLIAKDKIDTIEELKESIENQKIRDLLDEQYTEADFAQVQPALGNIFEEVIKFKEFLSNGKYAQNKNFVFTPITKDAFSSNMDEIIQQIKSISEEQDRPIYKYKQELAKMYTERSYEEVQKFISEQKLPMPQEYTNFARSELRKYQRPFRITTNYKLQLLINGKTSESVTEFYETMKQVYSYMRTGKFETTDPVEIEKYKTLCDVGICEVNTNDLRGIRREIQVYLDVIDGEINDKNISSVYCPFVGDHLGNEVEYLVRLARAGKVNPIDKWYVFRNRMLFSLKSMESSKSKGDYKLEVIANPVKEVANREQPNEREESGFTENMFMREIVYKNSSEIDKLLNDMVQVCSSSGDTTTVSVSELLQYIQKNEKELYRIIKKWTNNEFSRSRDLINEMYSKSGALGANKRQIEFALDRGSTTPEQKLKLTCELAKNELYSFIMEKLLEHEQKKTRETGSTYAAQGGRSRKLHRRLRLHNKITKKYKRKCKK